MHIFSYVITHDSGFAPNPFGGFLTLATCKPVIRRQASRDDYILGTGSSATVGNNRLVFAGRVADVIPIADFGVLPIYEIKRPLASGEWWRRHGDNIYFLKNDEWKQRRNIHHSPDSADHDLSGKNVLVCRQFWYFGKEAIDIPLELHGIIKKGPGHKKIIDQRLMKKCIRWLTALPEGINGMPEMEEARITTLSV